MTNYNLDMIQKMLDGNNGSVKKVALLLNMNYQTLLYNVKKNDLKFHNFNGKINVTKEALEELYQRLGSLSLVATELGATKEGIRCLMKRLGVEIKPLIRYTCDDEFFANDSENSFYWAGFFAADGCLKDQRECFEIYIGLSSRDKNHLEKFKNDVNFDGPIKDYLVKNSKRNPKWNDTMKSELTVCSKGLYNSLMEKFNITPRKSLTYKFPQPIIASDLLRHFLRGYFDGDGSIFYNEYHNKYLSFRGTFDVLNSFKNIFKDKLNINDGSLWINNNIWSLQYACKESVLKILDYLYKDATVYLDRKYAKAVE